MLEYPLLLLVDGHSLAFRSYYAFGKSRQGGLRTSTGIPTSVCFGFFKSLLDVMASHKPDYLAITFDLKQPTFRHEADENYKADRTETPQDFIEDVENLKLLLQAFDLSIITAPGYEADDILGTLSHRGSQENYRVKILSGDQDLFQLINLEKNITVLHLEPGKGSNPTEFLAEQVYQKLQIYPHQVIDYKALCGDKSDNIPGVKGIGKTTAVKLLGEYHSLENIYAHIEDIKGATRKKLEEGKPDADHSQILARIIQDVPLEVGLEDLKLQGFDQAKIQRILEHLQLQTFLDKVNQIQKQFKGNIQLKTSGTSVNTEEDTSFFTKEETEIYQQQKIANNPESKIKLRLIQTSEDLKQLVAILQNHTDTNYPVAWDTETTSLEHREAELVGIGCCWGTAPTDVAYIPLNHTQGTNLDKVQTLDLLRPILESDRYPKTFQNAKYDRLIFRAHGIELKGVVFDPMLANYVLDPEDTHNLIDLTRKYLGSELTAPSYNELVPKGKTIADINIAQVAEYCGMQVYVTFQLVDKIKAQFIDKPQLMKLLTDVEQPLEPVLADMEYGGVHLDIDYLQTLAEQLDKQLEITEIQAYEVAGEKFNLASPKQLSKLLFETLELSTKKTRQIKTGYSTDVNVLEKLQGDHPIIDIILEHRTLAKLKSTYVDALPTLVDANQRIHTSFNQTITATGRLSSSDPNLQNIPIKTEFSSKIRKAFITEPNWLLVSADYSQIELRILAHLSQEPILLEAYQNNQDVHTVTAKLLFEKATVTPEERRLGKTINFGVIYGMGAQRFAREAKVSSAEGKIFIERFNQRYSQVFAYLERVKKQAISQGYVETILGRRRYFDFQGDSLQTLKGVDINEIDLTQLKKKMGQNDAQLLRAAANAPIQGSSADIIKMAMVQVHQLLSQYQSQLVLQVHDELVFEIPETEWQEIQPQIKTIMEQVLPLSVPLVVDIHAGKNWKEAK
ncbi:DNA polymerase I [Planktothrix agardhii 1032]|uniref:DNA polymerase I n=1 Tax=Planktothrix agardhii TaxID=1160 RepID=UPI001D0A8557|nr:DNA polymerase I [Planktothrix agardhii]MCB8776231.1 DNA polymerase I [Planktothrix agardhii 1031]MCF3600260.1 DNA polymerase I [Planktothrix agardhii 1032]